MKSLVRTNKKKWMKKVGRNFGDLPKFWSLSSNLFCSEQVLSCCKNLKSCILCNYSKNLGFAGLIRSNIVHPHETARISFQRL